MCPEKSDGLSFLGIYSKNREEWAIADLACMASSVTIVPVYESLGKSALSFVINQTEVNTMCAEKKGIETLIELKLQGKADALTKIVSFDADTSQELKDSVEKAGMTYLSFSNVIRLG